MIGPQIKKAPAATEALEKTLHRNHTTASAEKEFSTLRARFALAGHVLSRTNPADGTVAYFSRKWGMVREFKDLAAVASFLERIA